MTTSDIAFRTLVNGALLPQCIGKTVTIHGVVRAPSTGSTFKMSTCDNFEINIILRKPLTEAIKGLVEIHGIVKDRYRIICDYLMDFPEMIAETYDTEFTNEAVKIIRSSSNAWVES